MTTQESGMTAPPQPARWNVALRDARTPIMTDDGGAMLLWTDPPYGTGDVQEGRAGKFDDPADIGYVLEAIDAWLPLMADQAVLAVCCDYRLASTLTEHVKGKGWWYRGEVIWEFGLGRPRTSWWPVRHNNVLTFTRRAFSGKFDKEAVPRAKRLAPKKGYEGDKAAGSVWEYTLSNSDGERVGYPNQKPTKIIEPFIKAHTSPGDLVVDPFCGSGSTGVAALKHGRRFYGGDTNPAAVAAAVERLTGAASAYGKWGLI